MSGNKATQKDDAQSEAAALEEEFEGGAEQGGLLEDAQDTIEGGSESELLRLELEKSKADLDEYRQEMLRARAEVENIRKRAQRDVESAHRYGLERFIGEFLAVKDSMDLGHAAAQESSDVESLREGIDLTLKMFDTAFQKVGVEEMDPLGEKFDPDFHQAMTMEEREDAQPGTVVRVMQKGYLLNERLIRPAMVIVAKAVAQPEAGDA